jgi:hypothetical protein
MSEAHTKGHGLSGFITAVGELLGAEAKKNFIEALPEEVRHIALDESMKHKWIPIEHLYMFYDVAAATLFKGDYRRIKDISHRQFINDMTGIYSIFFKALSPKLVVSYSERFWRLYHDSGTLTIVQQGANAVIWHLEYPSPHPAFWYDMLGSFEGGFDAVGAKDIRSEVTGGGGPGDSFMDFRIDWE